ncbi:Uncharacterized protein FWK35_00032967, partial [Aphis craccivora]
MKNMVDFEFNNQITESPSIILLEWNVQKFNVLNKFKCFDIIPEELFEKFKILCDDLIFIKNKQMAIHNILIFSNISDHRGIENYNKEKQNPVFGKLIHEALSLLIMCTKFNIVYKYVHNFANLNDGLTEDGYYFFKIRLFYPFLNIVKNLENVQGNLMFDIDMVVKDVPQLNPIYITSDNRIQKYIVEDIPENHSTTEIFIIAVFEWVKRNLQIDNLTIFRKQPTVGIPVLATSSGEPYLAGIVASVEGEVVTVQFPFIIKLLEEINQHTNLVQINTDDDNVYTFTIKNLWDNNTFEIIDVLIIATIKIQNDHTENIKFST